MVRRDFEYCLDCGEKLESSCPSNARDSDLAILLVEAMGTLGRAATILAKTCQWSEDSDGNWDTSCGETFVFEHGGPKENKARWCQYCGGELVAVPHPQNENIQP